MTPSSRLPALRPTEILPPRAGAAAAARRLRLAGVSPAALDDALALSDAAQEAAAGVRSRRTLGFLLALLVAGLVSTSGNSSLPRTMLVAEATAPAGMATPTEGPQAGTGTADDGSIAASPAEAAAPPADGGASQAQAESQAQAQAAPATPQDPAPPAAAAPQPNADARPRRADTAPASGATPAVAPATPRPAPMPSRVARADRCSNGCAPAPHLAAPLPAATPVAVRPAPYVPPPPAEGPTVVDVALFPVTASAALVGHAGASVGAAADADRTAVETLARFVR